MVKYFFSLQPSAYDGVIYFSPSTPAGFAHAAIKNVPVLDGSLDVDFRREGDREHFTVVNRTGYTVKVGILPAGVDVAVKLETIAQS